MGEYPMVGVRAEDPLGVRLAKMASVVCELRDCLINTTGYESFGIPSATVVAETDAICKAFDITARRLDLLLRQTQVRGNPDYRSFEDLGAP